MNYFTFHIDTPVYLSKTGSIRSCAAIMLFTCLLVATADAQFLHSFGLKAGPVLADQHWDYAPHMDFTDDWTKSIWGIDVGASSELLSVPYFTLQLELHYIQKGRIITVNGLTVADNPQGYIDLRSQDIKQRFEYLTVPVLMKFGIDAGAVRPFVSVGPSLEFLISHPTSPVYDQFQKTELAATLSTGAELSIVGFIPRLSGEVRYIYGLTNSYHNENVTVKIRALAFLTGVLL